MTLPFMRWWRRAAAWVRPRVTVGVDLLLMQPRGANGGVKPLVFSFLQEIQRAEGRRFRFVFFASAELAPELQPLLRPGDRRCAGMEAAPHLDVLYAPFGRSTLMRPGVPTVSLIVDLLHRDLPSALPIEEVNYRHEWFGQIAQAATSFQCISRYTAGRLQAHYDVDPAKIFVTHLPVHRRLETASELARTVASPVPGPFFFYPANFWPHKNHETLIDAYRIYHDTAGASAWPLVFTGHADARMETLKELVTRSGLSGQVIFLGHLEDAQFAAVWRAAGALVYPSLHEGFGIPLLEAMAFGCPIVASDTTSLPEVGGDACIYVDPRDARALAAALRQIANEPRLREDYVSRGQRRLAEFSLPREAALLSQHLVAAALHRSESR